MYNLEWDRLSVYPYNEENIQEMLCRIFSILTELKKNGQVFDANHYDSLIAELQKNVSKLQAITNNVVSLESLGAKGDGVTDDIDAFDKAKLLLDKGIIRKVIGYGSYCVSKTIYLSAMNGIEYDLGQIKPTGVFRHDYLIQAGDKGGSQGNLIFKAVLIDGIDRRCGGINITSTGSSTFDVGTIINCGVGIALDNPVQISSDNLLKGNYIKACNYGIVIRSEKHSACEGTMIRYNFIYDNDFAGILLGKGSHYTDIQGVTDFNGKKSVLLTFDNVGGLNRGDVLQHGSLRLSVVEVMQSAKMVYAVSETQLADSKSFRTGDIISGRRLTADGVVNNVQLQNYLDIINANDVAGFSRNTMMLAYCGGVYGDKTSINTDTMFIAKTGQNERNLLSGVSIWSNPVETTFSDYLGNKNIFKYNHKDSIDINGNGIYSRKIGNQLQAGQQKTISNFNGEKLESGTYFVSIIPETRNSEFAYTGILYWDKAGGNASLHDLKAHNLTASVSGTDLKATLSSISSTVWTTYLKIS